MQHFFKYFMLDLFVLITYCGATFNGCEDIA